jgi:hypothetical protein
MQGSDASEVPVRGRASEQPRRRGARGRSPALLQRRERELFRRRVDGAAHLLTIYSVDAPRERVEQRNRERGQTFSMVVPPDIFALASDMWEPFEEGECRRDVGFIHAQPRAREHNVAVVSFCPASVVRASCRAAKTVHVRTNQAGTLAAFSFGMMIRGAGETFIKQSPADVLETVLKFELYALADHKLGRVLETVRRGDLGYVRLHGRLGPLELPELKFYFALSPYTQLEARSAPSSRWSFHATIACHPMGGGTLVEQVEELQLPWLPASPADGYLSSVLSRAVTRQLERLKVLLEARPQQPAATRGKRESAPGVRAPIPLFGAAGQRRP